jgi:serine/threonine protein kinase
MTAIWQARRRLAIEAINLEGLAKENVKVPRLLDHNTSLHNDPSVQLYLVMELISGETLDKTVGRRGGKLPLEQSVAIAKDLCRTMAAMHRQDVLHRDLKPANLMVRDFDKADLVVLDLGLSFDRTGEQETVTRTGETMKNELLALPEAITATGDRRDKRSDITNIVAVFFYCLSGHLAGHLRDQRDLTPHRRSGQTMDELLAGDSRRRQVEFLLDLGFTPDIEGRFQTIEELQGRFASVLTPVGSAKKDPIQTAKGLGAKLRLTDRKLQLQEYVPAAQALENQVHRYVSTLPNQLKPFTLSMAGLGVNMPLPTGIDMVAEPGFAIVIGLTTRQDTRSINLRVGAKGNRCVLLWTMRAQQGGAMGPSSQWHEIAWFDTSTPPDDNEVITWIKDIISTVMEDLAK